MAVSMPGSPARGAISADCGGLFVFDRMVAWDSRGLVGDDSVPARELGAEVVFRDTSRAFPPTNSSVSSCVSELSGGSRDNDFLDW
jgi:hypothetical protein